MSPTRHLHENGPKPTEAPTLIPTLLIPFRTRLKYARAYLPDHAAFADLTHLCWGRIQPEVGMLFVAQGVCGSIGEERMF